MLTTYPVVPSNSNQQSDEISLKDVDQTVEYFEISHNTASNYVVKLREDAAESWTTAKPWPLLRTLVFVTWNSIVYSRGDLVYVRTGSFASACDIFEIAEVTSLDDSRSVFRGYWYYCRTDVSKSRRVASSRGWPRHISYVESTHMDIVMWDSATGLVPQEARDLIWAGRVIDMSEDVWVIKDQDVGDVSWTKAHGSCQSDSCRLNKGVLG